MYHSQKNMYKNAIPKYIFNICNAAKTDQQKFDTLTIIFNTTDNFSDLYNYLVTYKNSSIADFITQNFNIKFCIRNKKIHCYLLNLVARCYPGLISSKVSPTFEIIANNSYPNMISYAQMLNETIKKYTNDKKISKEGEYVIVELWTLFYDQLINDPIAITIMKNAFAITKENLMWYFTYHKAIFDKNDNYLGIIPVSLSIVRRCTPNNILAELMKVTNQNKKTVYKTKKDYILQKYKFSKK